MMPFVAVVSLVGMYCDAITCVPVLLVHMQDRASAAVSLAELVDTSFRRTIGSAFVGQLRKPLSHSPYRLRRVIESFVAARCA